MPDITSDEIKEQVGITTTNIKNRLSAATSLGISYRVKNSKPMTLEKAIHNEASVLAESPKAQGLGEDFLALNLSRKARLGRSECL